MCSFANRLVNAATDYSLWPRLKPARAYIPTYNIGGSECMMITRDDAKCWVVYCHGNSVTLSDLHLSGIPDQLVEACTCNFVAPSYPTRRLSGEAHDRAVVETVQKVYDRLREDITCPIYVVGRSVGVGVALGACQGRKPAGIALISGFASVKALAPWTIRWALPNRLDNIAAVRELKDVPMLIMHGDTDEIVPTNNSRQLAEQVPNCTLHIIKGMTHIPGANDLACICAGVQKLISGAGLSNTSMPHYQLWHAR